jgi:hypothetical protein
VKYNKGDLVVLISRPPGSFPWKANLPCFAIIKDKQKTNVMGGIYDLVLLDNWQQLTQFALFIDNDLYAKKVE